MNFSGRNFNQVQLDMLGANQAMKMKNSGKVYNKKSTLHVVGAIVLFFMLLVVILVATSSEKPYVYYNGNLYLDHGYQTSYTEIVNLEGTEAGKMTWVKGKPSELSKNMETTCEAYDGGTVYMIPGDKSQIIICTPEFKFYRLTLAQ